MRIKYGDEPAKFMESEVELNEAIQVHIHPFLQFFFFDTAYGLYVAI